MRVRQLIEKLQAMPQDHEVICQVVGQDDDSLAWNMLFDLYEVDGLSMVQLCVEHPRLRKVPTDEDLEHLGCWDEDAGGELE